VRILTGLNLFFIGVLALCYHTPGPPVAPPPDRTLMCQNDNLRAQNLRLRVELIEAGAVLARQECQTRELRVAVDALRRVLTTPEPPDVPASELIPPQNLPVRP
jgi:hypothetical protein